MKLYVIGELYGKPKDISQDYVQSKNLVQDPK